ncbi:hypothetical protein [Salinispora arenicola]|uniref:hypothetical protein n=1 Tax=Salinispora arenicola TaxID=168697 RepID=UPI000363667E|nr:hypothetical protein [Salinispora arenicola]
MTDHADKDTSGEAAADQAVPPPREPVDVTIVGSDFPDLAWTGRHLAWLTQPVMANWTRIGITPWSWSVGAATRQMAERLASFDQIEKSLASIETAIRFSETTVTAFTRLLEILPPNWPDGLSSVSDEDLFAVVQDEGIPLVWVPRGEIVSAVLAAPDRQARIKILLARSGEVMQDCRDALHHASGNSDVASQVPLAHKAIDAFDGGHTEAAQALAVVVTETAVSRTIHHKYHKVHDMVKVEPANLPIGQVRLRAALAPIRPFYTQWSPHKGAPPPAELSRHVSVHQADAGHYTDGNALIAVMLASSVLRALQDINNLP